MDVKIKVTSGHNHSKHLVGHSSGLYAAIYYGSSEVDVGNPFDITCRIAIEEPTQWIKDGEVLNGHRHGHTPKEDYVFNVIAEGVCRNSYKYIIKKWQTFDPCDITQNMLFIIKVF